MSDRLKGKIALITGGGRGIGRAIALGFAREGARVAIAARTRAEVEAVAAEIEAELGVAALAVTCDIVEEEQVKNLVQAVLASFGQVDILVNNAGIGVARPVYGMTRLNWDRALAVNLTGTFLCTKHVWKPMVAAGGGSILNISSLAGTRGMPMLSAYAASKWGQIGFTLSVAEEGKPVNIRVNALAPGKGDTAIRAAVTEDKTRLLRAEDHVGAAIFLASDEARYVTGQVLELDYFDSAYRSPWAT
ncbi:MAG TPA: SDR family NAD(P)-dependent oxidoreductase [Anaerolineales bacterium]|nr:SDR family NAD(P)-dependent oxidoreductase [Anaerolineales bacterium]HRF50111.1 SDR family NAD(P)-dependent oxidoreductase [Anaerolineales bacterium]